MDRVPALHELSRGASRRLAVHVAKARYEALPGEAVHAFKRALLDFVTCAVSGSAMPVSRALLSYYEENDATRTATVIGSDVRLSAPNAALVNGANTHGLDFDDGHTHGSAHPAGAIFPAVLAAAEQHGADPRSVIVAAVIGYDVMLRIAAAMHPATARRGFHNTALAGVFGAAAAVSSLLRLDAAQTGHALGLAGSFAGGTREYLDEGAEVKRVHPGKAARDGLLCAEFAHRGITGPSRILEGRYGFFHTHAGDGIKWSRLFDDLGRRFEIEQVYFKPYPCCRHYHAIIDGLCALREAHGFGASDVEHVDIGLYAVGVSGHDHRHCDTLLDAQMSAPCAAALAIVDGQVSASQFLPESLQRAEVLGLLPKIDTRIDDECERLYPGTRSGVVQVTLRGGARLERRVLDPKGEAANPMTDADLEQKFRANCEPVNDDAWCDALLHDIRHFEQGENVAHFLKLLARC
ncbi:MAG: MmgE/PrpD family protein [Betaproteobacteria bacterium]